MGKERKSIKTEGQTIVDLETCKNIQHLYTSEN